MGAWSMAAGFRGLVCWGFHEIRPCTGLSVRNMARTCEIGLPTVLKRDNLRT